MMKTLRLLPVLLFLTLSGCDLWDHGGQDEIPLRRLIGEWDGARSFDTPISNLNCEGAPLTEAVLDFRLSPPQDDAPRDALRGSGRLRLGSVNQATCVTIDDYVTVFRYNYPQIRLQFGNNFAFGGTVSESRHDDGRLVISGTLTLGDRALPFRAEQAP
jgi:hypothetical protein